MVICPVAVLCLVRDAGWQLVLQQHAGSVTWPVVLDGEGIGDGIPYVRRADVHCLRDFEVSALVYLYVSISVLVRVIIRWACDLVKVVYCYGLDRGDLERAVFGGYGPLRGRDRAPEGAVVDPKFGKRYGLAVPARGIYYYCDGLGFSCDAVLVNVSDLDVEGRAGVYGRQVLSINAVTEGNGAICRLGTVRGYFYGHASVEGACLYEVRGQGLGLVGAPDEIIYDRVGIEPHFIKPCVKGEPELEEVVRVAVKIGRGALGGACYKGLEILRTRSVVQCF